ncbi:hypothetical protein FB446DRAFT_812382, partial [Lentinula raphanica]
MRKFLRKFKSSQDSRGQDPGSRDIRSDMFNQAHDFTITDPTFNAAARDINNYYYLSTDEEKKLQDWLAAPDCSINFATALNQRVVGTGQWILNNPIYLEWEKKGSILWIQGKAGSGKTFLITSIIDNLRNTKSISLVVYHYFDICNNIGDKSSFQGLLLSLLLQLGAHKQRIHPALKSLHESSKHGLSHSKPTDNKLANTLERIIKDMAQQNHQIYIIIDALDECKDSFSLLEFVTAIASFSLVRILISSRNYQPEHLRYPTVSLTNNIMVDNDIATFVNAKLSLEGTDLRAEVQKTLMTKADGGFRYIDCQIQSLKTCASVRKVHQALQQLPVDLNEIYTQAIRKCQKSPHSEDIHHLLLWLLYSFKPLHMSQVAVILSINISLSTIEPATDMLIGLEYIVDTTLVTITDKKIVQLAHASVKEFLLQIQSDIHQKDIFDINSNLAHNVIAQMCLI